MAGSEKHPIRLKLTEEQRKVIREATGQDASEVEFTVEELEERIAPMAASIKFF